MTDRQHFTARPQKCPVFDGSYPASERSAVCYIVGTRDREDFTLSDVQAITSFRRSDLHNHIKRGILKYLGHGGAGRKRQFSLVGLYESGVLESLVQAGLTLVQAAQVVYQSLSLAHISAFLALRCDGSTLEQAQNAISEQPKRLLCKEWSPEAPYRDLASPHLWVFLEADFSVLIQRRHFSP